MPSRKLGRITPHASPRLRFADYVVADAPPPPEVHRSDRSFHWGMLANGPDPTVSNPLIARFGVGDCVIARTLHAIQHFHLSAHTVAPEFTGDHALELYAAVTGYDPSQTVGDGSNPTDQGTDPNAMDSYWRTTGVPLPGGGVDKLAGYLAIDPRNRGEIRRAIWEFDCIGIGVALTESAERATHWVVQPNDPVVGGHEILGVSYDRQWVSIYSWGEVLITSYDYLAAQSDQVTAYLSQDELNKSGVSETGVDWDRLSADFQRLVA